MIRRLLEPITNRAISFETRGKAAVIALIVLSVMATNLAELTAILLFGVDPTVNEISRHEKRLEPLRKVLPQRGIVGYVTDAADPIEWGNRYHMTRYALAPLIVVPGAGQSLVVGDFSDAAAAKRNVGARLVRQDFGEGLVLFAGEAK